jgi:molybdopterin-guanine dinucleotide biosynthesis protein A
MGGVDKALLDVGGRALLDRVRAALTGAGAGQVVLVGPEQGGGPVAAIAAGLERVTAAAVVVLPADLPFVTPAAVAGLLEALSPDADAAIPVDAGGRDQLLCAAWRTGALRRALTALGDLEGVPVRRLVEAAARVTRLPDEREPSPWFDCDTEEELARARRWAQDGRL